MANAVTSKTGVIAGDACTFKIRNNNGKVKVYVAYTKGDGTSVAFTIGSVNPHVHASTLFQHGLFATATLAPITVTLNANGNHRLEINLSSAESLLTVTFVFTGGTTQAVVCDFSYE